jgi:hypothetical protein
MMSDAQTHDAARPHSKTLSKEEEEDGARGCGAVLTEARLAEYHRLHNEWSGTTDSNWLTRDRTDAQAAWDIKPHAGANGIVLGKAIDHALGQCRAELTRKMQAREAAKGKFSSYFGKVLATAIDTNQAKTGGGQAYVPLRQRLRSVGDDDWLRTLAGRTIRDKLGSDEAAIQFLRSATAEDAEGGSHVQ